METEEALLLFQHLLRGTEALKRTPYPHLTFELNLARLCEMGKLASLREILQKLEELSRGGFEAPAAEEKKSSREPSPRDLSWEDLLEEARRERPRLAAWLSSLNPPEEEAGRLILRVPAGTLLAEEDFREELRSFFRARTGKEVEIMVEDRPGESLREKLLERPEVKDTLAVFGGKVAWIKPRERSEA